MTDDLEQYINGIVTVGPEDKVIVHVEGTGVPIEQIRNIADKLTSMFEDRSVVLVGDTIHINVVKGKDGTNI